MVDWVQRTGGAVPTQRIEPAVPTTDVPTRRKGDGETKRVASSLFSGSAEAEGRARAFDEHADDVDNELAASNGRG